MAGAKEKLDSLLSKAGLEFGGDPQANRKYIAELAVAYSFAALLLYLAITIASTSLIASENPLLRGIAATSYIFNYYMCHQMPERSFFLFGEPMGLCERCMAIFIGALIAFPAAGVRDRLPRFMQSWWFVALALVPIGVDGVTQLFGMRESTSYERISTGFAAAFAVTYYLISAILEKYSTRKTFYRKGIALPTIIPLAFLAILLLAASALIGAGYKSEGFALAQAELGTPGAAYYRAYYLPPHATRSIQADPFMGSYSDPILRDVYSHPPFAYHELGVWAALALNASPEQYGNYAYISKANGDYYYFDAWTGQQILRTRH